MHPLTALPLLRSLSFSLFIHRSVSFLRARSSPDKQVLYDGLERKLDAERRRVEDDLEAHFVSVQRICDKTALPAVVPRLKHAIQSHLDMTAQLRVLRAPSTSATVSSQQKLRAWEDLKILAFTRVAASSLSLAILSLHMRIMLNVLSRQLYLEHALEATPSIHTKVEPRLVCFISHHQKKYKLTVYKSPAYTSLFIRLKSRARL